jgi:hypothetical protein
VTENQAFEEYRKMMIWISSGKPGGVYEQDLWTFLDEFDAKFSVEGTVEVYYSNLNDCYVLHLDGIGTYTFDGEYFSHNPDGHTQKDDKGNWTYIYQNKDMVKENIYVKEGSFSFSPTLVYE